MYLYHHILIGTSVLSMCYAESESNHAVSSESYDRGGVSLSDKFNLIHTIYHTIYTTSNPRRLSRHNYNRKQEQKRNVRPHIAVTESSDARLRNYVPGYNVDLQAVNNKLNQNGIYANNPNFLVKNKQVNVNHLQPQSTTENQGIGQHNENITSGGQENKRQFFYVKASKVQLNLARTLHIASPEQKASVNVNSSFRKFPSLPCEFFSNTHVVHPPKTQLHPVQNSKIYMAHGTV